MKRAFLLPLVLLLGAGCPPPPPPQPTGPNPQNRDQPRDIVTSQAAWDPIVQSEGSESFIVVETVPIQDTISNARRDAMMKAMRSAIRQTIMDILRDPIVYEDNEPVITRRIMERATQYMTREAETIETGTFDNDRTYGIRMRVWVDRNAIEDTLQVEGIIRQERESQRVIIVIYRSEHVNQELIDDLSLRLADHFNNGGFYAIKWDEVLMDITANRNLGDRRTEQFFQTFVDNPRIESMDDYQGGLQVLREYGAVCIGFNVANVARTGAQVEVLVEGHIRDLQTGRIFVAEQRTARRRLTANSDIGITVKEVIWEAAQQLADVMRDRAHDWFDQRERIQARQGRELRLVFRGFRPEDQAAIGQIITQQIGQNVDIYPEGGDLVSNISTTEEVIPFQNRMVQRLRENNLNVTPPLPNSRASEVVFVRAR